MGGQSQSIHSVYSNLESGLHIFWFAACARGKCSGLLRQPMLTARKDPSCLQRGACIQAGLLCLHWQPLQIRSHKISSSNNQARYHGYLVQTCLNGFGKTNQDPLPYVLQHGIRP